MKTIALLSTLFSIFLTLFIGYWWWQLDRVRLVALSYDREGKTLTHVDKTVLSFLTQKDLTVGTSDCVTVHSATTSDSIMYCFHFTKPQKFSWWKTVEEPK